MCVLHGSDGTEKRTHIEKRRKQEAAAPRNAVAPGPGVAGGLPSRGKDLPSPRVTAASQTGSVRDEFWGHVTSGVAGGGGAEGAPRPGRVVGRSDSPLGFGPPLCHSLLVRV